LKTENSKGLICRPFKKSFWCQILETGEYVEAIVATSAFKKSSEQLVVGDLVTLQKDLSTSQFVILDREQRKSAITRFVTREGKLKVVASNCDVMVVVFSCSEPSYKRGMLERYLVRSVQWGLPMVVVFNKWDETQLSAAEIQAEMVRLQFLPCQFYAISAIQAQSAAAPLGCGGVDELRAQLHKKLAIFQGSSGVGKSKLISLLSGHKFELKSQELGKVGKGVHTTTWSEIVDCGEFHLIDSPGIRAFSLDDITKDDLITYFPDISPYVYQCQFSNCQHQPKARGCAFFLLPEVTEEEKTLKSIILSRLDSYQAFLSELKD
jgi:ribosome biogenesis GTPase